MPALIISLDGSVSAVPKWSGGDFVSIWKVMIARNGDRAVVAFAHEHQGLDGQPEACPG